jgi:formiminotetrahydrofolate cyclodeaminase
VSVATSSLTAYIEQLASTAAVPGGGSAAAVASAMGAALVGMAARLTAKKAGDPSVQNKLEAMASSLDEVWRKLLDLSQADIDAYQAVLDARRKQGNHSLSIQDAYRGAAEVPLRVAQSSRTALELEAELRPIAWKMIASDLDAGAGLLRAGLRAALENVEINLPELTAGARESIEPQYEDLRRAYR